MDAHDAVYPGPYPGALRDVLGLTVEEWLPLRAGERVTLTWQKPGITPVPTGAAGAWTADVWTEAVVLAGAKPVAWYADGPAAGGPAITRHDLGAGRAWYVSARADAPTTAAVLAAACESAGVAPPATPAGLANPADPADPAATADPRPRRPRRPRRTRQTPRTPRSARPPPEAGRTAWSWCAASTGSAGSSPSSITAPPPRPSG